jgi:ParB-like chromosome segregation protein Spo0J
MRDRIKSIRRVKASELVPDDRNWRLHGDAQRKALAAVLEEIGFADVIICRELPDKKLGIIDGHLRADLLPDEKVPVVVTDLDEAESGKLLATLDPLAAMAGTNAEKLSDLLSNIESDSEDYHELLERVAKRSGKRN